MSLQLTVAFVRDISAPLWQLPERFMHFRPTLERFHCIEKRIIS